MAARSAWPLKFSIPTKRKEPRRYAVRLPVKAKSLPFEMRQLLYGRKPRIYRILFTIEVNTVHILYIRRPGEKSVPLN
jgi:hypothetical protein